LKITCGRSSEDVIKNKIRLHSMGRAVALLGLVLILSSVGYAFEANMYVFAVTDSEEGVPATLAVSVRPGKGDIAIDLGKSIVGESTQESVREAITAATRLAGADKNKYDFFVKIDSPAEKIDGPSAGLAIALATYGALKGKDVPDTVSATGQIDADGTVYPVGGIFPKVKTAHETGVKLFLIPAGERNVLAKIEEEIEPGIVKTVTKIIDITKYAKQKWGMDIYEVESLEEAVKIVFEGERPEQNAVKKATDILEEFAPPPANVSKSKSFKNMAENLVKKARGVIENAKSCNLTLKDRELEKALRDSLKTADSMARRAAALIDKGYYYTAANYAFLAVIDADTYWKICEHPSILNPNSIAFQDLLQDTENKIKTLETQLTDANINKNNFEWIGAARDRFIRAKYSFETLRAGEAGKLSGGPAHIRKLISIREWLDSAEEMYTWGKKIEGPQIGDLGELAKQAIIAVEDISEMVDISDESIHERIAWAKTAYNMGWYYTAALEAASAKGLAFGNVISDRKDPVKALNELFNNPFEPVGIWDELYQNHALYYYEAAKFYKKQGKETKAKNMAKTGVQLYYMAEEIKKVHESVYSAPTVVVHVEKDEKQGVFGNGDTLIVATAVLVVSAVLLAALLVVGSKESVKKRHEEIVKAHKYRRKIAELEKRLKELEAQLNKEGNNKELKKEIAKIKRLLGRYRSAVKKLTSEGA